MADEGATPEQRIIQACRMDNETLLREVISELKSKAPAGKDVEYVANILNKTQDGRGMGALHVAAEYGSYDVLDELLDQEGLEIDETDRMEKDTPLHTAVRYVNELPTKRGGKGQPSIAEIKQIWTEGQQIVDILVDAGCDPRIRNKAKLKPFELVDPRNDELRKLLQKAEYAMTVGNDVVADDDDDGPTGSASDSD